MKRPNSSAASIDASRGNVSVEIQVASSGKEIAKVELARRVCAVISKRKLTQARAAAALEVDQPKVSTLIRGKLGGFSTDKLFRFLNALGQDVEIIVQTRRRHEKHASIRLARVSETDN